MPQRIGLVSLVVLNYDDAIAFYGTREHAGTRGHPCRTRAKRGHPLSLHALMEPPGSSSAIKGGTRGHPLFGG
jgi:hypothetical protein